MFRQKSLIQNNITLRMVENLSKVDKSAKGWQTSAMVIYI